MSEHTPGPWTCRKALRHFKVEATANGYGPIVAEVLFVGNANSGWTSEGNARLIAAAPCLLAALKTITEDYMQLCGDGLTETSQPDCLRFARAAIAKAEELK